MSSISKMALMTSITLSCITSLVFGDGVPFKYGSAAIKYAVGSYIGIDQGYLEGDILMPIFSAPKFATFAEFKGYRFENGKLAFSAGVAVRSRLWNKTTAGVNLFYDARASHFKRNFNRIGIGFEWLSCNFDVRLNGYFPLSNFSSNSHCHVFTYVGSARAVCRQREFGSLEGFDFELGAPLCLCNDYNISTYVGLGTYYYRFRHFDNYWGGMWRVNLDWYKIIGVQLRGGYDVDNKGTFQALFSISFPFEYFFNGFCGCKPKRNPMWMPVERNGIIFTKKCCDFAWNWDCCNTQ